MQVARVCRSQLEIQSHRNWLKRFVRIAQSDVHPIKYQPVISPGKLQVKTYASRSRSSSYRKKPGRRQQAQFVSKDEPTLEFLQQFRDRSATDVTVDSLFDEYQQLSARGGLSSQDLSSLGQGIRDALRLQRNKPRSSESAGETEKLLSFTEQVIRDIKAERVAASPSAYVYILCALRESGSYDVAINFWQWLEQQDDQYLDLSVYAAAIDLLAARRVPLSELEELYQTSLVRFPGLFLAYHLSPDAIVTDREKSVAIGIDSLILLQAIAVARLSYGDTRNAYMALDTALRLFPTSVSANFFAPFVDRRPISEAFTTFAVACRSGQTPGINLFQRHLKAVHSCSQVESLSLHICTVRAMFATLYMHLGAGGQVKHAIVNDFVVAITQILRLPGVNGLIQEELSQVVDKVAALVKKTLELFVRYRATPLLTAFNSIIVNVGGHGRSRDAVGTALTDLQGIGLSPDAITRRSVLTAVGLLGDRELVRDAWQDIVLSRETESSHPDFTDFVVLARAAKSTDQADFAYSQFIDLRGGLTLEEINKVETIFSTPYPPLNPKKYRERPLNLESVLEHIQKVDDDLNAITDRIQEMPAIQDFSVLPPVTRLLPFPNPISMPESKILELYEELSTEQNSRGDSISTTAEEADMSCMNSKDLDNTTVGDKPNMSSTNLTYGTLRYENWKDMNYLLSLAQEHDEKYIESVSKAAAAGKKPPTRNMSLTWHEMLAMQNYILDDLVRNRSNYRAPAAEVGRDDGIEPDFSEAKAEIIRLRHGKSSFLS